MPGRSACPRSATQVTAFFVVFVAAAAVAAATRRSHGVQAGVQGDR